MPLSLAAPMSTAIAGAMALATVAVLLRRRARLPRAAGALGVVALMLLAVAAGEPTWDARVDDDVVVMVDLSPSTRTAAHRDRQALQRRIGQLLGRTPHRVIYFPQEARNDAGAGDRLADVPADTTVFAPPPQAAAVVLFSDGRFAPPAVTPPIHAVVDPGLEQARDNRVETLSWQGDQAVAVVSAASATELTWSNAPPPATLTLKPGRQAVTVRPASADEAVAARVASADSWPENDALVLAPRAAEEAARWWVSAGRPAPPGWVPMMPSALPTPAQAWLDTALVVLDDVRADALSPVQRQRLGQYVRELGGTLILLGGGDAFAAGGYAGTVLDDLSPLASHPPSPTRHWVLLTDGSGSMAQAAGSGTRWRAATEALSAAVRRLPGDDLVSVGAFASDVTWWGEGRPVQEARTTPLPPPGAQPRGPTNLDAALGTLRRGAGDLRRHILLLTDGEAPLESPERLADALKAADAQLWLLAIGDGQAVRPLTQIAEATGGGVLTEADAARWSRRLEELIRRAAPDYLQRTRVEIVRERDLPLPATEVDLWNRTWLKGDAERLASADVSPGAAAPMLARWRRGEGQVIAAAWPVAPGVVDAWATELQSLPRDPRLRVTLETSPALRLSVDAVDGARPLNELRLRVVLQTATDRRSYPVPQVGPGEYELALAAPRETGVATVFLDDRVIHRAAVAGRYPPEFDAVGNDVEALRSLALRSGGEVVEPSRTAPLEFPRAQRPVDLTTPLVVMAFMLLSAALAWHRWNS